MAQVKYAKLDDKGIAAAIAKVHQQADSWQLNVHKLLWAIANRWQETGDIRPAVGHVNSLLDKGAMLGARKNAIRSWVEKFFGFVYVTEGEAKDSFIAGKTKAKDLDMDSIRNVRWWEFKPEPAHKPLDFEADLMKLLDKAEKRAALHKDGDNIDLRLLNALKATRSEYIREQLAAKAA